MLCTAELTRMALLESWPLMGVDSRVTECAARFSKEIAPSFQDIDTPEVSALVSLMPSASASVIIRNCAFSTSFRPAAIHMMTER